MSFATTALPMSLFVAALFACASCTGASRPPAGSSSAAPGGSPSPASSGTTPGGSRSPASSAAPAAPPAESASARVLVYLVGDVSIDCVAKWAVERAVAARTPAAALRALLAGPTADELAGGYSSWFSAATADALVAVTVTDGIARVSFRNLRPIIPNASSSCGSEALLSALDATLRQFPEIRYTRYSFLGDEAAFYEWLQREPPPAGG